jgi:hypothetical protein
VKSLRSRDMFRNRILVRLLGAPVLVSLLAVAVALGACGSEDPAVREAASENVPPFSYAGPVVDDLPPVAVPLVDVDDAEDVLVG